ncbi:MAG: response regulator [Planctomycetes bacterium]|nr:response regulator [Planctomycetota bacterium]
MQINEINILIIDDEKDVCDMLKKLLTQSGYNVNIITKPKRTIQELKKKTYHLIILDLKMPDIKGENLLSEIRKVNSDILVIILTAYPSLDSAVKTLKDSAFDYIKKPFKINELREVVRKALRSKMLLLEPEEELNLKIGRKLREIRKERKLTLKQLAERAGISVSLISQIERAESAASISTLNKIVSILNIKLGALFKEM